MTLINSYGQLRSREVVANEFEITENNTAFIEYIKVIAAISMMWLDNLPRLGSIDSFKINVIQTTFNSTSFKKRILFTDKKY